MDPRFTDYINEANSAESWRRYVNHQTTSDPREVRATTPQCQVNSQSPTTSSSCLDRPPESPSTRDNDIQYAQLDLPMELVDYDEEAEVFQTPEVGSVAGHFRPTYVNVPLAVIARQQGPVSGDVSSSSTLTYAQLDLGVNSVAAEGDRGASSFCVETAAVPGHGGSVRCEFPSREKPEMYAHIDFRRTMALSTRTTSETEDEGFRKTRHNSNIETLHTSSGVARIF